MSLRRVAGPLAVLVLLGWSTSVAAQDGLEPGETRVEKGDADRTSTDTSGEEEESDGEDSDSESSRSGVEQLDVSEDRVRPDELPPPSASKTDLPDVLRNSEGNLPAPPSEDELAETGQEVRTRVYELVSLQEVDSPGDSTPLVQHGHAVFVGGHGKKPPILLSTYFWLDSAKELYLVPRSLSTNGDGERHSKPTANRRSVDEMTVRGKSDKWIQSHRDQLARARLFKPDRHRNLVTVVPDEPDKLDLPDTGLELFDLDQKSPMRLYGYTPKNGKGLQKARLLESHPDEESLVYYLQTTYSSVFGAPIVGSDGSLLVLTAFDHPNQSGRVLAVPPKPIAAYVDDVLATLD